MNENPKTPRSKWRRWRRRLRWGLIIVVTVSLLAIAGLLLYLNKVGLPDFIKEPLLTELRSRGLDLNFSRLRWRWHRGLVADEINLGRTALPFGPQLFIDEAEVRLNHAALRQFRLQVDALIIRQGRFCWPLPATANAQPLQFNLDDITAELHFLPHDQWRLTDLSARFLANQVHLSAWLTNATWLRHWQSPKATQQIPSNWTNTLRRIVTVAQQLHYHRGPPHIEASLRGDARDPASFNASLILQIEQATSPWGSLTNAFLSLNGAQHSDVPSVAQMNLVVKADGLHAQSNWFQDLSLTGRFYTPTNLAHLTKADFQYQVQRAVSPWISARHLQGDLQWQRPTASAVPWLNTHLTADQLQTRWGQVGRGAFTAQWTNQVASNSFPQVFADRVTNVAFWQPFVLIPTLAHGQLALQQVSAPWGDIAQVQIDCQLKHHPSTSDQAKPNWGFWTDFAPFEMEWKGEFKQVRSIPLFLQHLSLAGHWRAPELSIDQLRAYLYDGELNASALLNVTSRLAKAQWASNFDPQQISLLFPTNYQRWLNQIGWPLPPLIKSQASLQLPPWTNRIPQWRTEVLPNLVLESEWINAASTFRGQIDFATQCHGSIAQGLWSIPDLHLSCPGGQLQTAGTGDLFTQDFFLTVYSQLNPKIAQPLLAEKQQRGLELFQFSQAPELKANLLGNGRHLNQLTLNAHLSVTNFSFRGEAFNDLVTEIQYSNKMIHGIGPRLHQGPAPVEAQRVSYDVEHRRLTFIQAHGHIAPGVVTRVIGPKTAKAMEPYQFLQPPAVTVNGWLILPGPEENDLNFDVEGGPFHFSRFNLPMVKAQVHWQNDRLTITNFQGSFYQGQLIGVLDADFAAPKGTDLNFKLSVNHSDLHLLLKDVSSATNRLEGIVSGNLAISYLNSADWKSWQGWGNLELSQGVIWDVPVFGVISKGLNMLSPGLGNNRADKGAGTFTIKDSVIYTRDMVIHTPGVRLQCNGSVDFNTRVNARIEAVFLGNTPVLGFFMSLALKPLSKLFEYQVTGTLKDPKIEPVYIIPKILLAPLRPFHTLKDLLSPEDKPSGTPKTKNK